MLEQSTRECHHEYSFSPTKVVYTSAQGGLDILYLASSFISLSCHQWTKCIPTFDPAYHTQRPPSVLEELSYISIIWHHLSYSRGPLFTSVIRLHPHGIDEQFGTTSNILQPTSNWTRRRPSIINNLSIKIHIIVINDNNNIITMKSSLFLVVPALFTVLNLCFAVFLIRRHHDEFRLMEGVDSFVVTVDSDVTTAPFISRELYTTTTSSNMVFYESSQPSLQFNPQIMFSALPQSSTTTPRRSRPKKWSLMRSSMPASPSSTPRLQTPTLQTRTKG